MTDSPTASPRVRLLSITLVTLVVLSPLVASLGVGPIGTAAANTGVHYVTDSGFEIEDTSGGAPAKGAAFPDSDTLDLPGINLSAAGNADITLEQRNGTWSNLSSVDDDPTITVTPEDKQEVALMGGFDSLNFSDADYGASATDADLVYSASSDATLRLESTGLSSGETVNAVDVDTDTTLDSTTVKDNGSVTFGSLSSGSHVVNLKVEADSNGGGGSQSDDSDSSTPTTTATPSSTATGTPGSTATLTATQTPSESSTQTPSAERTSVAASDDSVTPAGGTGSGEQVVEPSELSSIQIVDVELVTAPANSVNATSIITLENDVSDAQSAEVRFVIDGEVVAERNVTVSGSERTSVKHSEIVDQSGTHEVVANVGTQALDGGDVRTYDFRVGTLELDENGDEVASSSADPPSAGDTDDGGAISPFMIGSLVAIVILLVGGGYWWQHSDESVASITDRLG